MSTHLSRYFESVRKWRGLRPGQLASLAGFADPSTGGNRVRTFELSGVCSELMLAQVARALRVEQEVIAELLARDEVHHQAAWEAWVTEPVPPAVFVRLMPAIWIALAIPSEVSDQPIAVQWIRTHPTWHRHLRCVAWSRKEATYLREDGTAYVATATRTGDPRPWIRLR